MLWLRQVVAGFPTSLQFDLRPDHVEIVVDKLALELVLLRILRFFQSGLFLKCPALIHPCIADAVSTHKFKQIKTILANIAYQALKLYNLEGVKNTRMVLKLIN
jgi:hypothetical protein